LLRFVIGDVEAHSEVVNDLFEKTIQAQSKLYIASEVLVEMRYVLSSFYNLDKVEIVEIIRSILRLGFIEVLTKYKLDFDKVCDLHQETNLSFEDCLYLQICLENNITLLTFDTKLAKVYQAMSKV
jgi:predicted nucleic acid-binding protein